MTADEAAERALRAMDARTEAALAVLARRLGGEAAQRVQVAKQIRDSDGAPRVAIEVDARPVWRLWWERDDDDVYTVCSEWLYAPGEIS